MLFFKFKFTKKEPQAPFLFLLSLLLAIYYNSNCISEQLITREIVTLLNDENAEVRKWKSVD